MLDIINATIAPFLPDLIGAAVTALIGYAVALVRAKFGIEIEARNREALHSALTTGALLGLAKLGVTASKDEVAAASVAYVKSSVPGALARLAPSDEVLTNLALSKVQQVTQGK
ncbi:hypothetical protein [Paenirhodobacter enshiensis]|uniref:hypothetical protein n=1 Tax=Paenirhodobacter enshiensis TaxID=1105367 RepID=UPI0035B4F337